MDRSGGHTPFQAPAQGTGTRQRPTVTSTSHRAMHALKPTTSELRRTQRKVC